MGVGYRPFIPSGLDESDLKRALAFDREYFQELQNKGYVKDLVFGFNIEDDSLQTGNPSTFSLGGIDENIVKDIYKMDLHPVSSKSSWTVFVEKIGANGVFIADGLHSNVQSPSGR